jgi:hypothetical protein
MAGLKEICAMILAGGVGAGSVVAVQEAKPKPRVERKAPAVKKASARPAPRSRIDDCPTLVAPLGGALVPSLADAPLPPQLQPFGVAPTDSFAGLLPPGSSGGGGSGGIVAPLEPPPPPGGIIPEPAAWAMMVSGFGLVGVALRIRPRSAEQPTSA